MFMMLWDCCSTGAQSHTTKKNKSRRVVAWALASLHAVHRCWARQRCIIAAAATSEMCAMSRMSACVFFVTRAFELAIRKIRLEFLVGVSRILSWQVGNLVNLSIHLADF